MSKVVLTKTSKVGKGYLKVRGWQKGPKGPRSSNGTKRFKVGKSYIKVYGWQKVPKGPRPEKGN